MEFSMKKIFVLGGNKVGKTTFAQKLKHVCENQNQKQPLLYEAGAWCRKIHQERFGHYSYEQQLNPEFRQQLYDITNEYLLKDSHYSFKVYQNWIKENNNPSLQILIGLRNIEDFKLMLEKESSLNHCFFLIAKDEILEPYLSDMINLCTQKSIKYSILDNHESEKINF